MHDESKPQPIHSPMPTQLSEHPSPTSPRQMGKFEIKSGPGPILMDPRNRRTRRATEKMKAKEKTPPNPNSNLLHQRLSGVELAQRQLANISDQNARVFSDSLQILEVMGFVMQRVMNDMVATTVRLNDVGGIDFQSYLHEYQLCMLMASFCGWLGSLQKPEEEKIIKATADDVHVFGGS